MRRTGDSRLRLILNYAIIIDNWVFSARNISRFPQFNSGGNPPIPETATKYRVALPVTARVYAIMLTDTSLLSYPAIDVVMYWDREKLGDVISSFSINATRAPSSFNWLFIGSIY